MRNLCIIAFGVTVLANPAAAQERPFIALLHNVLEDNSLQYDCVLDGAVLNCDFVQTRVRREKNPADLKKELANALKGFDQKKQAEEVKKDGTCKVLDGFIDVLEGASPKDDRQAVFQKEVQGQTAPQRSDTKKTLESAKALCQNPTEASYADFIEQSFDVMTRTCIISSSTYKQSFRIVDGADVWVVAQEGAEGPCGLINVSRFEKDGLFWVYYAKKVVTNRSGESMPGFKCTEYDENEYKFDWKTRNLQLSCDYVKFGPL